MANNNNNNNLNLAKQVKNDEFYTRREDIEKELIHYKNHFKGKVIYCNCDDYEHSNFTNYFRDNFEKLGITKLISACYNPIGKGKIEVVSEGQTNRDTLSGDGDFRSEEVIRLLKESDIIITNPPFSLFREYIAQLMKYDKKFLVVGNMNAITYKEIFPLLKDNKMWVGYTKPKEFMQPDGNRKKIGPVTWFTNLEIQKHNDFLDLRGNYYSPEKYPKYDNYDAINVSRVKDIPCDYAGAIGVPITFLDKYNPKQFKLIGATTSSDESPEMQVVKTSETDRHGPKINGKEIYKRLIIKPLWAEEDAKGQVFKTLQKYSCEFTSDKELCYIGYSNSARDLVVLDSDGTKGNHIYFINEETLIKAVEEAGEANIKKYIFGVE